MHRHVPRCNETVCRSLSWNYYRLLVRAATKATLRLTETHFSTVALNRASRPDEPNDPNSVCISANRITSPARADSEIMRFYGLLLMFPFKGNSVACVHGHSLTAPVIFYPLLCKFDSPFPGFGAVLAILSRGVPLVPT